MSVSQACGSTPFILAVTIRLYIAAARRPPRSDPQNSHAFRPSAIMRSFCPSRADGRGKLSVARALWPVPSLLSTVGASKQTSRFPPNEAVSGRGDYNRNRAAVAKWGVQRRLSPESTRNGGRAPALVTSGADSSFGIMDQLPQRQEDPVRKPRANST
jgi:hypothetical protein